MTAKLVADSKCIGAPSTLPAIFKLSRLAEEMAVRKALLFSVLNHGANSCCLGFNALGKLDLNERPGKVVFLVPDLVDIAFQIVGKESVLTRKRSVGSRRINIHSHS